MNNENQTIVVLVAAGAFFISLPFFMQKHDFSAQDKMVIQNTVTKKPVKIKKDKERMPASTSSPYSINDFKPENLLNKKILTKKQYDEALEASKHVGISYVLPKAKSNDRLTSKDLAQVREVERKILIAKKRR